MLVTIKHIRVDLHMTLTASPSEVLTTMVFKHTEFVVSFSLLLARN